MLPKMSSSLSSQGTDYYVHVSAYNMKGWGPPLVATPACAAPSSESVLLLKTTKVKPESEGIC